MNTKRELIFLRAFAFCLTSAIVLLTTQSFKTKKVTKFDTIDVKRINVVEDDGTVKMLITNAKNFPSEGDIINGEVYHKRTKRPGLLFYTEDGKECGGLIYDGKKRGKGHSSGLSLTFDQYDGDQVMQLITLDNSDGNKRYKAGRLVFNDRPDNETREVRDKLIKELEKIKDRKKRKEKYEEYKKKGLLGVTTRVVLGQTPGKQNGLFLNDDQGRMRAKFIIDENNAIKLVAYDEKGNVVSTWPENKK
ncbi:MULTISPECIES: hypothetical protein [unclassified Tenacibaculum]|uniref:hypothetical protein n=1 Tax=unclassified Tenacibaculum TaxID=2635139 RepID=UPI001F35655D|nr:MULTISPECIES: hypothetical protein [unclassified Tenacibaculum]MCF2876444.1 hypothetical protein [Tenacibaculum sp. Cn5-1]MCF2936413.1 hypothetical protein [Tenacibaculum sp. Cn5-34]MCG7512862.1 hypothetical protein [Tenacibaculum sp. Cn5-46]